MKDSSEPHISDSVVTDDPALRALLESQYGLRQLVRSVPDIITVLDCDLRIVYLSNVSDAMADVDLHGMHASAFLPEQERDKLDDLIAAMLEDGEGRTLDYVSPSGETYESRFAVLRDVDDTIVGFLSSTRDVTAQRRAEADLERAIELERDAVQRLRELDEIKNEFVAKVAHDLRTPITTISGFADTMLDRWDVFSDNEKREFLGLISNGADRLMLLVEDILEVSHLESREFRVSAQRVELRALLVEFGEQFAQELTAGRIVIDEVDSDIVAIGDARRILQVLNNLVANALRHTPDDTVVRVHVSTDVSDVRVSVIDHGVGIRESDIPKLFQKFAQVGEISGEGTGLGLYISKSLVEAQHGRIWLDSEFGVGTTVTFTLPKAGSDHDGSDPTSNDDVV